MNKSEAKHEDIVLELFKRLTESGRFQVVSMHTDYWVRGERGEVDVMAYFRDEEGNQRFHFYEVKSSNHPRAVIRAYKQYDKFKKTHPTMNLEGYLVSPTGEFSLDF